MDTANGIIRTETDQDHIEAHIASIKSGSLNISEEMLPELITARILEIIHQAVDPLIQQKKDREYVSDVEDLYRTKLFLLLQEKLGFHPYS